MGGWFGWYYARHEPYIFRLHRRRKKVRTASGEVPLEKGGPGSGRKGWKVKIKGREGYHHVINIHPPAMDAADQANQYEVEGQGLVHQDSVEDMKWHNGEKLEKGGPGSGKKGHFTPRKPYPGEDAHKLNVENKPNKIPVVTNLPPAHYSDPDTPNKAAFRQIIQKRPDFQGKIGYDQEKDAIVTLSEDVEQLIQEAKKKAKDK